MSPNGEERAPNGAFQRSRSVDGGRRSQTARYDRLGLPAFLRGGATIHEP